MPSFNQLICSVASGVVVLTAAACSADDPAAAEGASSTPTPQATDQIAVLDSAFGSADDPAPLEPGAYAIPFIGADDDAPWGKVQVPAGWGQDRLLLATGDDLDPHLRRLELLAVDQVAVDPCAGDLAPVEPTVTGIVDALTDQRTVHPSEASPVTLDDQNGQLVSFRVPADLDVGRCADSESLWTMGVGPSHTSVFPGWNYRVWVVDVEGDPLVVMAAHGPETTDAELEELDEMVEGLTFTEPQ
jgi:hypothetical protein